MASQGAPEMPKWPPALPQHKKYILRATPSAAGPLFFKILSALASRDHHLGPFEGLGASFLTFWEPFWHLGSTSGGQSGFSGQLREAILAPRDHPGGPWEQQDGHEVANDKMTESIPQVIGVAVGRR